MLPAELLCTAHEAGLWNLDTKIDNDRFHAAGAEQALDFVMSESFAITVSAIVPELFAGLLNSRQATNFIA